MDYLLTSLRYFKIENYKESTLFPNDMDKGNFTLLNNSRGDLERILKSYGYLENFGLVHLNTVKDNFACVVIYNDCPADQSIRTQEMHIHYMKTKYFAMSLWFIKDNSVLPYVTTITSDKVIPPQILRNTAYYTCSDGVIKDVSFTYDDIKEAEYWVEVLTTHAIKISGEREIKSDKVENISLFPYSETTSLSRALLYLDIARKETFLPSKIASYITILEILCAVNGENTYKVSERVAALLGGNSDEKMNLFYSVKKAYDFRSKFVHGSHINYQDVSKVSEISIELDEIVRNVLKKIVKEHTNLIYSNKKKQGFSNFEAVDKEFINIVLNN
ncbi:HEPN domain-containing protein [Lysinibacillus sp.]|uniref:HEPN domain-containing protein n=1 Tax=Lysinibacillus sp. TaxID=1869345 RepID=UPI0028A71880|nr:HEPN domain-containing protein [Lysinibacillus sp.]